MEFFTIGVYHSKEDEFFNKLIVNKIDTLCDIRQRRGVRGKEYSFVNSNYLQQRLKELNIRYEYIKELAPTNEVRQYQKDEDKRLKEKKRDRKVASNIFVAAYKDLILSKFDMNEFIQHMKIIGAKKIVFLCLEQNAEACHRNIIIEKLHNEYCFKTKNL
jgi:uncharacterized protein (DUF488 family)